MDGLSLIGFLAAPERRRRFRAINPATAEQLDPEFICADSEDIDAAARLANSAFSAYASTSPPQRAAFLHAIAGAIERDKEAITQRAHLETALPLPRLQSELARTCMQLRLFADLVQDGSWVDARIDHADPARQPIPKPDVRSMLKPLGPVVVFGSSNFPLAFSVAGGDTASALAVGCPVIVKAHPAHPGTSKLVGRALLGAAQASDMPEGVFSLLFDDGYDAGTTLVRHPLVKAVAFTGSRKGGLALARVGAARSEPIPVYAEMGSVNPVVILPQVLRERSAEIAAGLHTSVTLGVGQFCTNPGLVFLPSGKDADVFLHQLGQMIASTPPAPMLTIGICEAYQQAIQRLATMRGVRQVAAPVARQSSPMLARAALFATDTQTFLSNQQLMEEVFGPSTLAVHYKDESDLIPTLAQLEGQLTASIHGTDAELAEAHSILSLLEAKAGRIVVNGFPTGVEVCHAMVHGGPFPATSDGRSTSVGTRAIARFTRPVCYQNMPDVLLPDALKQHNPLRIARIVDGKRR